MHDLTFLCIYLVTGDDGLALVLSSEFNMNGFDPISELFFANNEKNWHKKVFLQYTTGASMSLRMLLIEQDSSLVHCANPLLSWSGLFLCLQIVTWETFM